MKKLTPEKVKKYLQRITYQGPLTPNLETLQELCRCHATQVPQDTLDLFGGPGKFPDLDNIYENVVANGRGGFCYEQNGLFGCLLANVGFDVVMLEGSYFMEEKDEFSFKFNHMLLKVHVAGSDWMVDVGFGYPSFYLPLKLEPSIVQEQVSGLYRIRKSLDGKEYYIEKQRKEIQDLRSGKVEQGKRRNQHLSKYEIDADWKITMRFGLTPREFDDFLPGWKKHVDDENSFFRKNSFLQIFTESGSRLLWGSILFETEFCGPLCEKVNRTEMMPGEDETREWENLRNVMEKTFGVTLDFKPLFCAREYHG